MALHHHSLLLATVCLATGKLIHSRKEARRELRRHDRHRCRRCRSGCYQWREYPCEEAGTPHWHIGHLRLAEVIQRQSDGTAPAVAP